MSEDSTNAPAIADKEAIQHLKQSILSGKQWYIALLEAIGLWGSAEEIYNGQTYRYLIAGEAFDWLLLAERLCSEVDGLLPEEEKSDLLFSAIPPIELSPREFKKLIGETKFRAYLNYFYGVVVEEALILAVEEEVYKERRSFARYQEDLIQQEAYHRVYDTDMTALLHQFRQERGYPHRRSITLREQKEFTYWLFKYRLKHCDKERVASDTKKALQYLQHQWALRMRKKPSEMLQG
ncbi:MAG TPA: hypothetical protein VJ441_02775, partial [Dehalococcoidia bacterium]|nr:hypothetical protein [Dehalococcoidia bacterium]